MVTKTTVRKNIQDLPYSLHDMVVTEMGLQGDQLILGFEHGFVKIADPCLQVDGELRFHKVDQDFCFAYVLDFYGNAGPFSGEKYFLADFAAARPELRFEIVNESYGFNYSRFAGYLYSDGGIKECVVEIYHLGDMEYHTREAED